MAKRLNELCTVAAPDSCGIERLYDCQRLSHVRTWTIAAPKVTTTVTKRLLKLPIWVAA